MSSASRWLLEQETQRSRVAPMDASSVETRDGGDGGDGDWWEVIADAADAPLPEEVESGEPMESEPLSAMAKRGGDAHLYGPCLQWHWGCSNCRCQPFSDLVQMPESNFQGIQWVTARGGCTGRVFGYLWEAEQRFGRYVLCGCFFPGRHNMFAFLQSYRITICWVSSPFKVFKYSSVLLCVCFYCVFQLFPQGNKRPREKGVLLGKKPSAAAFSWFPWILFSPCTSGLARGCVPEPGTKKVGQHGEIVKRTELRWRALNFVQQLQILHVRVSRGAYISRVRLLSKCTRSLVRAWMFLCFVEQYRSELVASNGGLPSLEWFRKKAFFFTKDLSC